MVRMNKEDADAQDYSRMGTEKNKSVRTTTQMEAIYRIHNEENGIR